MIFRTANSFEILCSTDEKNIYMFYFPIYNTRKVENPTLTQTLKVKLLYMQKKMISILTINFLKIIIIISAHNYAHK